MNQTPYARINAYGKIDFCRFMSLKDGWSIDEENTIELPPVEGVPLCGSKSAPHRFGASVPIHMDRLPRADWERRMDDAFSTHQPPLVHYARGTKDGDIWEVRSRFAFLLATLVIS